MNRGQPERQKVTAQLQITASGLAWNATCYMLHALTSYQCAAWWQAIARLPTVLPGNKEISLLLKQRWCYAFLLRPAAVAALGLADVRPLDEALLGLLWPRALGEDAAAPEPRFLEEPELVAVAVSVTVLAVERADADGVADRPCCCLRCFTAEPALLVEDAASATSLEDPVTAAAVPEAAGVAAFAARLRVGTLAAAPSLPSPSSFAPSVLLPALSKTTPVTIMPAPAPHLRVRTSPNSSDPTTAVTRVLVAVASTVALREPLLAMPFSTNIMPNAFARSRRTKNPPRTAYSLAVHSCAAY